MAKNLIVTTRGTVDLVAGEAPLPVVPVTLAADRPAMLELSQPDLFDVDAHRIPTVTITVRMPGELAVAVEVPAQALFDLANQADPKTSPQRTIYETTYAADTGEFHRSQKKRESRMGGESR